SDIFTLLEFRLVLFRSELLGEPVRQRPAYEDDQKTVSGTIHAFSDPSGRYKELELDFDSLSGVLRSVFVYPPRMTWEECRRLWGDRKSTRLNSSHVKIS